MKLLVTGEVTAYVNIEIDMPNLTQEDIDEMGQSELLLLVREHADNKFGGIREYVGNGGSDKLIGVSGSRESITADGSVVEWVEVEENDE